MKYKLPPLKELQALADELQKNYARSNAQRLSFLALFDQVNQNTQSYNPKRIAKVLMGLIIFELEQISSEYYLNPRSTLYLQILEIALVI